MSPSKRSQTARVALYTRQPFIAAGVAAVLQDRPDLSLACCEDGIPGMLDYLRSEQPDILLLHLISGIALSDLREIRRVAERCPLVLWGDQVGDEFAFQAMQLGVRSLLPAHVSVEEMLTALRNVHLGMICFERDFVERVLSRRPVALTSRQGQIVSLVAQGLKNREIAVSMGITEGTVKLYMYKLFKKLGTNSRLDLALYARNNLFGGQSCMEERGESRVERLRILAPRNAAEMMVH